MSERGFSQISSNLAEDQACLTHRRQTVEDLMNSEAMTTFLDGTKESGLYSILVKPTQDGIRSCSTVPRLSYQKLKNIEASGRK